MGSIQPSNLEKNLCQTERLKTFLLTTTDGGSRKGSGAGKDSMSLMADDEVGNIIMRAGGGDTTDGRSGQKSFVPELVKS